MSTFHTPEWVKDAVFYQIFPDRFAQSDRVPKPVHLEPWDAPPTYHGFKGGDLLGIVDHLDYLQDLGITAIYLNPIFQSAANHRYHTFDYYQVDPLLGGNDAFYELIDAAHERNIRVVIDGVFNHASRGFFQFNHILENGRASPYLDWFRVYGFPLHAYEEHRPPNYAAWWNLHALPEFNHDNHEVREYLWSVGEYWIEQGADGWRLDVPNEIGTPGFWQEFRRRIKTINSDAYIVGEIWDDARLWLTGDRFDAVMNYLFTKACIGFFAGHHLNHSQVTEVGYAPVPMLNAQEFAKRVDSLLDRYPREATLAQLNLLDSHDTARFISVASGRRSPLMLATLFQMIYVGAPCVYYGNEIGMVGKKEPDSRRGFPWQRHQEWDTDLLNWFKRCIHLRHKNAVLRYGQFRTLYAAGDVYVCARYDEHDIFVVGFNRGSEPAHPEVTLDNLSPADNVLVEIWNGGIENHVEDAALTIEMPAEGASILRGKRQME